MDNRQNRDQYDQGYQAGWNQQGQQKGQHQDRPDFESDSFVNRNQQQNSGYGDVYHGNVKQREEETNQARGRNYGNQGGGQRYGQGQNQNRNQGGNQGFNQNYNAGGYGQVGNTGGGHDDWESHGSGSHDMGGNFGANENRYDQRRGTSSHNKGHVQPTRGGGMQYGGENYGTANRERRHDDDNNWWDRAKDKVSSWFDDDDNDQRNYRQQGGQQHTGGMSSMGGNMGSYGSSGYRSQGEHRGKGPKGYQRSDERIKEDVCDRLYEDGHVDASDIEVKVEGCEVILSGQVRTREEKRRAEDLVENISGVRHVENRLRVSGGGGNFTNTSNRYSDSTRMGESNRHDDSNKGSGDANRMGDTTRTSSHTADATHNTTSGTGSIENRSYTGNSGDGTGIGTESGTTVEIIRNTGNLDTNK